MRCLCAAALILLGCLQARAETLIPGIATTKESGITIRLLNLYADIPPSGFLPLRAEIRNDTSSARRWILQAVQNDGGIGLSSRSMNTLEVPANSARTFDLLVPVAVQGRDDSRYSTIAMTVTGYGISKGIASIYSSGTGLTPTLYVGMGKALSVKNWGPLEQRLEKEKKALSGTALDPAFLPADWRALSGFDLLIFTADEWLKISPASRGAIQDWLVQGGRLILCFSGTPEGLPAAGPVGVGEIVQWSLGDDLMDRLKTTLSASSSAPPLLAAHDYSWSWLLAAQIGRPELPLIMLIVFVVVFALIVGPVNFLWIAPSGHRHRLFWTTPAISVGASILLILLVLTREGFGGRGLFYTAILSLPSQHETVHWQEQVSRTGVLTGNNFTPSEPSLILPIRLRTESRNPSRAPKTTYSLDENIWGGDWFRSRSSQSQALITIVPSRERVEIRLADGVPQALSTFAIPLDDLFYFDDKGAIWRGQALSPGQSVALKPSTTEIYEAWRQRTLLLAGKIIHNRYDAFAKSAPMGKFFASAKSVPPVKTLPSIRWTGSGAVIFGEVAIP